MTTAADHSAVEDAFEALLAGRPAPEGAAGLAAFTEAVRATATSPGRPNAALAELLATGLLVDQSSPSARTARSAGAPHGSRSRIRRRSAMFFPALLAKFLSAGAIAKAATGATVVVVAFTGAGAAGLLPEPVQERFTSLVSDEAKVPAEQPPVEELAPVDEVPVDQALVDTAAAPTAQAIVDEWMAGSIDGSFGAWVSSARHDPKLVAAIRETNHNFGYYVSRRAQDKGMTEQDLIDAGVNLAELDEEGTVVAETPEADVSEGDAEATHQTPQDAGDHGNGNGNRGTAGGRGNGNDRN